MKKFNRGIGLGWWEDLGCYLRKDFLFREKSQSKGLKI